MIAEMIHSASLIHDDVIDQSFSRRGKPSVNVIWNHKKVSTSVDWVGGMSIESISSAVLIARNSTLIAT